MNRDHLLGFPPAALVSADCPDDYDDMFIFDYQRFPLGEPQCVAAARRDRLDAIGRKKQPQRDFENIPQPNPDGSYTPKHPGRLFASKVTESFTTPGELNHINAKQLEEAMEAVWKRCTRQQPGVVYEVQQIGGTGPVTQATPWTYCEEPGVAWIADWRALPARQAIPLSALVPPGVMVGGTEPAKWLVQGNQFFVNGREVDRKEFERTHGQTKQAEPAQQQKPVPAGALARALHRMNTDPDYRAQMAQRITAVNAKLAQERPSKGDGGIALPELTAGELARFTPCSIPITINTGGFDTGFDFPPNA